jgi:hypothetical protein
MAPILVQEDDADEVKQQLGSHCVAEEQPVTYALAIGL